MAKKALFTYSSQIFHDRYKNGVLILPGSTHVTETYSDSRTGTNNPMYKECIRRKSDASTNYSFRSNYRFAGITDTLFRDTGGALLRSDFRHWHGVQTPTVASDNSLREQALGRIKRKVGSASGEFNAMIPLAEIKETRGLINQMTKVTTNLLESLIDLKRGRLGIKPGKLHAAASNAWLTYAFGIRPTVSDLGDALTSIDRYLNDDDNWTKVMTGVAEKYWSDSYTTSSYQLAGYLIYPRHDRTRHLKYKYTCGMNFKPKAGNLYGLSDQLGLSMGNLPSTLWEIIPHSWILDMFGTIGDFLEDTFQKPAGSTYYATLATTYSEYSESLIPRYTNAAGTPLKISHKPTSIRFVDYQRTSIGALPSRALRFRTVDELGYMHLNKLMNLNAVFGSMVHRR